MNLSTQKGSATFMRTERGFAPILILLLLAAAGLLVFLFLSNTFSFKDKLFNTLFPKPPSYAQGGESVPDEILLKFKAGVSDSARENALKAHGLEIKETIPAIEVVLAKVPEQAKDQVIEALNKNPRIEYAEPNYISQATFTPDDYYFSRQWNPAKISAPTAWDIAQGDPSLIIAIIDSGADFTHEEFINKGTGALDDYGHGTQVAGVAAAATNNTVGIAGVCPLCQILSIKVLNSTGSGSASGTAAGIIKATDAGVKVINLSLGCYCVSIAMQDASNYAWNKGVVIVGAAGNDNTTTMLYPAAYPNVISVGATTSSDTKSSFSNYGDWIDVYAPGSAVYVPKMGGGYTTASGTSLAAPHVAGLVGLILSAKPGLSNQQVSDLIINNTDDLGGTYNMKRINAYKALSATTGIVLPPPDTTAPTTSTTSPTSGSTVSSLVDITADASDNVGVTKVDFYVDGALLGSDISSPYVASWDSTTLINGSSHNISSKAYDLAGNAGNSATVTVTVNNPVATPTPIPVTLDTTPPAVSVTSPTDGSVVKSNSTVNIQVSASDNVSLSKVEFYVNKSLKCTSAVSPYTCGWKVPGKKNTNYTLSAKAYDPSNNTSSSSVTVKAQ